MQKSTPTNDVKKAIVHNGEKLVIDKQIANAFAQHCGGKNMGENDLKKTTAMG